MSIFQLSLTTARWSRKGSDFLPCIHRKEIPQSRLKVEGSSLASKVTPGVIEELGGLLGFFLNWEVADCILATVLPL